MENVQVQHSDDGKWIYLAIKADKVIGQTEKGSEKVAQAFWEDIEGTNLKVNLLVLVKKDKKAKAKTVDDEEAPAINSHSSKTKKNKTEPVKGVKKLSRREREAAEAAEAAAEAERDAAEKRAARKATNNGKTTSIKKPDNKKTGKNNRPARPQRLAEPDYSDVDF